MLLGKLTRRRMFFVLALFLSINNNLYSMDSFIMTSLNNVDINTYSVQGSWVDVNGLFYLLVDYAKKGEKKNSDLGQSFPHMFNKLNDDNNSWSNKKPALIYINGVAKKTSEVCYKEKRWSTSGYNRNVEVYVDDNLVCTIESKSLIGVMPQKYSTFPITKFKNWGKPKKAYIKGDEFSTIASFSKGNNLLEGKLILDGNEKIPKSYKYKMRGSSEYMWPNYIFCFDDGTNIDIETPNKVLEYSRLDFIPNK